jgi:hypothetical protein
MTTHELKTWPRFFEAVVSGAKPFEVRRNDRDFKVGDRLVLREWNEKAGYTGQMCQQEVTYVLAGGPPFVTPGYVVLGLRPLQERAR